MVCTGNICRSPMAEGFFRAQLTSSSKIKVTSAGVNALIGEPAVENAQEIMRHIGIDISAHRAKQLDVDLVSSADLILVMEGFQKEKIEFIFPHSRGKVFLFGKWSNFEVPDPYRQSIDVFSDCLQLVERGWQEWKQRLIK